MESRLYSLRVLQSSLKSQTKLRREKQRQRETRSSAVIEMMICGDGREGMSNNKKRKNVSSADRKKTVLRTLRNDPQTPPHPKIPAAPNMPPQESPL